MAMNIHQEARRRQMFMDRVCEARRRLTHSHDDTQQAAAVSEGALRSEPVMCTDQGQFYQTREEASNQEEYKPRVQWNRPKKIRERTPEPKPCPPSLVGAKRDKLYKILHPHTDY